MTLLTKQEVAKRLGCSIRTVDRLMQTGDLPYFRPSPHIIRFDERDVEAHLAKCRVQVQQKTEPSYRRFTYVPGRRWSEWGQDKKRPPCLRTQASGAKQKYYRTNHTTARRHWQEGRDGGMPVNTWQELQREKELKRAADWQLAVDKLQVTFEAEHGGGYPECLKELTPKERLRYLRELGFRVRERYVFRDDDHWPGKPEDTQWARLTGGISVNLTDGFVCKGAS